MSADSSISNTAFQEALQRARQLAAKISSQPPGSSKRSLDNDDDDYRSDFKRPSFDQIGSKLSEMKNQNKPQKGEKYLNGVVFNGEKTLDLMLPGNKVGFVIGKGGDMIRSLQERACVKMVIYQDTNEASDRDKQLRITGPPDKVDYAKQLVNELLHEKEIEASKNRRGGGGPDSRALLNEYGSGSRITFFEYPVSPQLIGLVIGKGGETIRKIQADSGCKVQFDTAKVDAQGNKICQFTGSQESINKAVEMVKEIIDTITGGQGSIEEVRLIVPTSKTGSVIGRGGETIRFLKQQSGCNIELDKSYSSDNDEKCFILRGPPDRIVYAQQLVTEKVSGNVTVLSSTLEKNPQYSSGSQYGGYGQAYPNTMGQSPASSSSSSSHPYAYPQQTSDVSAAQDPAYASAMWAYYAQYYQAAQLSQTNANGNSSGNAQDQTSTDESAFIQWIEYYQAYGMTKEAEAMEEKLKEFRNSKKNPEESKNSSAQNGKSD